MIFLVISTRSSQHFTFRSLTSLQKNTHFRRRDRIIVVDNDNSLPDMPNVEILRNQTPLGFAANANIGLALSKSANDDLMLLNNDIVYTRHWLDYLSPTSERISVPFCNQDVQYKRGQLHLTFAMDAEGISENDEDQLEDIARHHRDQWRNKAPVISDLLIPFYCVHIPNAVSRIVGQFDERLGRGGGEDVDYRIRSVKAGFEVAKVPDVVSSPLHG